MGKKMGVGIIGAQPGRSWSAVAHVPALKALPDYEVVAVSTRRRESAEAAAKALGVPHAFDNAAALINHPDVDLVAVTVKVPEHKALVTAALDAGKKVFCEWPLGNGLEEAIQMRDHAKRAGVANVVGMQARCAPAVAYLRDLIAEGYVGEVLSTTLIGSGGNWGALMNEANDYTADKRNGATLLTIPFGHTIDAVCHVLGEFTEVSASTTVRRKTAKIIETGKTIPMTAEDQVMVTGTLKGGAVISAHYRGGMSRGTNLLWEINGTEGDIVATAPTGHVQIAGLTLLGGRGDQKTLAPLPVPDRYQIVPKEVTGPALNVGQLYARFADALNGKPKNFPDFDDAVQRHKLINAIDQSVASGRRVTL